ncbi:MAG: DoxX family membrane protein [Microbacteriaceae bacterium]
MTTRPHWTLAASLISGAARVALGVLWLIQGVVKYRAGFGAADIQLVVDSTASNSRAPWWFSPIGGFMDAAPGLFGIVMPALEVLLGILLIAGILTPLAAFASIGTLMLYWGADQLATQYPVMVVLSAVVLLVPGAGRFGVDGWWRRPGRDVGGRT